MNSIKNILKSSHIVININDNINKLYYKYLISDVNLIRTRFKKRLNRDLELNNPTKFNDKLQWLKLNWNNSLATQCADKYMVRQFVKERIGSKYLNEIYGIFENVEEINVDNLPKSFVLKGTHGSGFNLICKNKEVIDWKKAFKQMKRWLRTNYYLQSREWVYKDIKPRIVCEKFIEQGNGDELQDFRFFCFNGEPKFITVDFSITDKKKTRRNLYDLNWNLMEEEISYPRENKIKVNKPKKLNEMINLSRKLSADFPHARVDFYYIQEKIIFGEITFFHQSGMGEVRPLEFEETIGTWLKLPSVER
ncbi:ATP-grasp fold amidoligase family protein [Priestia sp. FSL R5-0597]|uniref:ATP-grasp fold amidoligase family protein n=1 Tax=Priestia TaxID=2800373 RepID=UPI0012B736D9|nr:ATP-grasp fold amidoligase family protein [Priestia megaterium]